MAGGGVWTKVAASGAVGWLLGAKYHSKKLRKTLQAQHKADQKQLYQQYYNDVYALQLQNAELLAALEQYYGIGGTGSSGSGGTKASGAAGGTAQQQQQQRRIQ